MRVFLVLALACFAMADPKGQYCGGVPGIVELKVEVLDAGSTMITGLIFGIPATSCKEPYRYNRTTNIIWLPLTEPDDCVGQQLVAMGVDPASVQLVYYPDEDVIDVQADMGAFLLSQCPMGAFDPKGAYCGGFPGLLDIKAEIVDATNMIVSGHVFGVPDSCKETYTFNRTTNEIIVPLADPDDCVGKKLSEQGIDPATINLTYNPSDDYIDVQSGFGSVVLIQCPRVVAPPKGAYCGGVMNLVEIKANVLNGTHFNITGSVFTIPVGFCVELYKYDPATNIIWLPIAEPDDCLGNIINDYGIFPDEITVKYDPDADELWVANPLQDIELTQCG